MVGWLAGLALAADEDVEEITVEAERPVETATERSLDRAAVETFPARSADELLRAMPGLHLSAHGGNGKAFQFLIRGFDAEHGSDLAVSVEGVPINEPSNVHGQGYLDLHFLPSLLVDGLDLVKGSYRAEDGDFAITGSADYHVGLSPEGLQMETTIGSDTSGGGTVAWRPRGTGPGTFLVAEGEGGIGVGEGRRYTQLRAAAGLDGDLGGAKVRILAFAYDGTFDSPGVLRSDDLLDGTIGFYDRYPVAGDGASRRVLAIGALQDLDGDTGFTATGWAGARTLRLDQNFSGWLRDPDHGDGTRQAEQAANAGAKAEVRQVVYALRQAFGLRAGTDVRFDVLSQTEDGLQPNGVPWESRVDADVRQLDAAGWTEARLPFGDRLTVTPALRLDAFDLGLRDRLLPSPSWAHSRASVLSPRVTAATTPVDPLTLFVAYGRGFRSPDARGIADGDLAPVMRSDSAEAGAKVTPVDGLSISATAFQIVVSNELVFDHLAGRFLSAGRTRRNGVEAVVDVDPTRWLRLQGDVTYTDGRFTAADLPIPYAPRWLVAGGVFVEGAEVAGGVLSGGVRAWGLGPRPLPSGFASHPALVGSLTSQLQWDQVSIGADVDNLFFGHTRDGEFVYPSWFDRSSARSELKVLHVTAGDPFAVRLTLGFRA